MTSKIKFYDEELPRKPSEDHSVCPVCNNIWESKLLSRWLICHVCYLSPAHFALMQQGVVPRGVCLASVARIG